MSGDRNPLADLIPESHRWKDPEPRTDDQRLAAEAQRRQANAMADAILGVGANGGSPLPVASTPTARQIGMSEYMAAREKDRDEREAKLVKKMEKTAAKIAKMKAGGR